MLNFFKKLFGKTEVAVEVQSVEAQAEVAQPKTLEFHEEIRQQVEAEQAKAPAKKPAAKKPATKKAPAKIKAEAKPAPAKKKPAPKKSK